MKLLLCLALFCLLQVAGGEASSPVALNDMRPRRITPPAMAISRQLSQSKLPSDPESGVGVAESDLLLEDDCEIDLDHEVESLEKDLEEAQDARAVAEQVNVQLKAAIESQSLELGKLKDKLKALGVSASDLEKGSGAKPELKDEVGRLQERLQAKNDEVSGLVDAKERAERDLQSARKDLRKIRRQLGQANWELERVRRAGGEGVSLVYRCKEELTRLAEEVATLRETNQRLENARRTDEQTRRDLHNKVQELKGNIRVYCRIRPLLGDHELRSGSSLAVRKPSQRGVIGDVVELQPPLKRAGETGPSRAQPFTFDKVFGPESSQQDVFGEISALVQSALDGYKVCIFAYGQTGSGKTYTMTGPQEGGSIPDFASAPHRGMIPRAVSMIFEEVEALEARGWKYEVKVSFLEIYNEILRDLLAAPGEEPRKLDIKHVDQGRQAQVTNLRVVSAESAAEVETLLQQATETRATAATSHNEQSSRSHSVFTMQVYGVHEVSGEVCEGVLNLIDLAGSERISNAFDDKAQAERLRETQSINKSLSSLCDVISALANKDLHIPFRNSKLTYLLQPSLGGDAKCLMFVNNSPSRLHFQESLNSLRFASKVSSVQLRQGLSN